MQNAYVKDVHTGALSIAFEVTIVYNSNGEEEKLSLLKQSFPFSVGEELTEEDVDVLRAEGEVFRAVVHGLRLLGYSDQSVRALALKLRRKGYDKITSESAAKAIESLGYINEEAQAERRARVHASKLKGKRLIISALYEDGYGKGAISSWSEKDTTDYGALCARAIEKKGGMPPSDDVDGRRKLLQYLARRGFTSSDVREAVKILHEKTENQ